MDQKMQAHIQRSQLTGSRYSATSKRLHGAESPFSPLHLLICFHKKINISNLIQRVFIDGSFQPEILSQLAYAAHG